MKNNHNYRFLFRVSGAVLLMVMSLESLRVNASDPLSQAGSFTSSGYNNPIELSNLALTQLDPESGTHVSVSTLVPTKTYRISFRVSDLDSLENVLLEVGLMQGDEFADSDLNGVDDHFEGAIGISNDADQFDFTYNPTMSDPTLFMQAETPVESSWSLVASNMASFNRNDLSYDFTFDFSVSKAAGNGLWALNVRVKDDYRDIDSPQSIDFDRLEGITMAWYGEITALSTTGFDWSTIQNTTDYASSQAKQSITLKTIANGPYQRLVSADVLWDGIKESDTALAYSDETLDATLVDDPSTKDDQSFAIRINESDLEGKGPHADYIQVSAAHQVLFSSASKTSELGHTQAVYAYLKLSKRFQNGSYRGSIHFGISN